MLTRIAWLISIFITIILIISIGRIIYNTHNVYEPYSEQLTTAQKATDYLEDHFKKYYPNAKWHIAYVPTGLYIESLRFVSPNSVHMSGYIWQKYAASYPKNFLKGFVFPGATDLTVKLSYEKKQGDSLLFVWSFDGNFTQAFDYSKYPLDYKIVRIRVWPRELEEPVILTPDLASYSAVQVKNTFGLDPRIILEGYSVLETFFTYVISEYDTNFGLRTETKDFPELYFNIPLKRNVISAFMTNLLPLSIVLILSFGLLHIMTSEPRDRRRYGFTLAGVTNVCAAMLFVVLLGHNRLRESIMYDNVIYLEYIYFIIYFGLIYTTALGFMVMRVRRKHGWSSFLFYEDCLILKVLYLPLIFGLILWATVKVLT